ncbi:MAG: hypothetical protein ACM3VS_14735 [Candidatus Dadabacteria bacterium]
MKKTLILFGHLLIFSCAFSQAIKEIRKPTSDDPIENKVNKGINFGLSLGFNTVFDPIYDARISPLDNKLKITKTPKSSFLLSTGVSVPLSKGKFGGRYYKKLDENNREYGPLYYVPYGFCFIATVNLITLNSGVTGSGFNQKLDGGLGFGYRVNDNFQLALTGEMISYRQPREFLFESKDQTLKTMNGDVLTAINPDDNNYFIDKYMPSLSFKFFYLIAYKPVK